MKDYLYKAGTKRAKVFAYIKKKRVVTATEIAKEFFFAIAKPRQRNVDANCELRILYERNLITRIPINFPEGYYWGISRKEIMDFLIKNEKIPHGAILLMSLMNKQTFVTNKDLKRFGIIMPELRWINYFFVNKLQLVKRENLEHDIILYYPYETDAKEVDKFKKSEPFQKMIADTTQYKLNVESGRKLEDLVVEIAENMGLKEVEKNKFMLNKVRNRRVIWDVFGWLDLSQDKHIDKYIAIMKGLKTEQKSYKSEAEKRQVEQHLKDYYAFRLPVVFECKNVNQPAKYQEVLKFCHNVQDIFHGHALAFFISPRGAYQTVWYGDAPLPEDFPFLKLIHESRFLRWCKHYGISKYKVQKYCVATKEARSAYKNRPTSDSKDE